MGEGRAWVLAIVLVAWSVPCLGADPFTRGDCNADGNIVAGKLCDIADAIFLLNYLFAEGPVPSCLAACNANGDIRVDIADAVYQLSYCFAGGSPPPAPFPACGHAPDSHVDCARFPWCEGGCGPQDARGVGPCAMFIGYFWDGVRCRGESGCSCEGVDCGDGFETLEDCYRAYIDCPSVCDPMDVRGVGACEKLLGWYWDGTSCRALSGCECEGQDCDRLYGSPEECQGSVHGCPPECEPMDVAGVGLCRFFLGWYWDGRGCQALSGCECVGEDCDRIFLSLEACEEAYKNCLR